jgi:hypothetical protein
MADKLSGARLKLERADKHIADLNAAITAFRSTNPYKVGSKHDLKQDAPLYFMEEVADVPDAIRLIVGDAIHNLRSALDHIAMQLWIAGGRLGNVKAVAFPIFDSAAKYVTEGAGKIKGARPDAIKVIDAIEPYHGGNGHALWILQELNNIDKHRLLVLVGAALCSIDATASINRIIKSMGGGEADMQTNYTMRAPRGLKVPLNVGDELFVTFAGTPMDEKVDFTFEIAFGEQQLFHGHAIVPTLHKLARLIEHIVDQLERLL